MNEKELSRLAEVGHLGVSPRRDETIQEFVARITWPTGLLKVHAAFMYEPAWPDYNALVTCADTVEIAAGVERSYRGVYPVERVNDAVNHALAEQQNELHTYDSSGRLALVEPVHAAFCRLIREILQPPPEEARVCRLIRESLQQRPSTAEKLDLHSLPVHPAHVEEAFGALVHFVDSWRNVQESMRSMPRRPWRSRVAQHLADNSYASYANGAWHKTVDVLREHEFIAETADGGLHVDWPKLNAALKKEGYDIDLTYAPQPPPIAWDWPVSPQQMQAALSCVRQATPALCRWAQRPSSEVTNWLYQRDKGPMSSEHLDKWREATSRLFAQGVFSWVRCPVDGEHPRGNELRVDHEKLDALIAECERHIS